VAATFEKAKTYVFAGMVIHNPKVGGSIPPPATNVFNDLRRAECLPFFALCPICVHPQN
jgi:hypothetical protein